MPLVEPSFFDTKNLFIDVKLSAIVGGTAYNYMGTHYRDSEGEGVDVIDIGFYKDNVAFGITNIEITVNTSLQPVIKIEFKDIAGSTSFGGDANKAGINYKQLFNWPPPKFRFSFKGYLGGQVTWLLNLKEYSIGFEPSDGSTKITAEFVPNQFGFMADIPYFYLKAVKKLREKRGDPTAQLSVFELMDIGLKVEKAGVAINENYSEDLAILNIAARSFPTAVLENGSASDEDNFFQFKVEKDDESFDYVFNDYYIPKDIKILEKTLDKKNLIDWESTDSTAAHRMLVCNTKINGKFLDETVTKLSFEDYKEKSEDSEETTTAAAAAIIKKIDFVVDSFYNVTKTDLEGLEKLKSITVWEQSEMDIGQLTISNVLGAIARDSAYLMGSILDAGLSGYFQNSIKRNSSPDIIGLNYPLINDTAKENQELPAKEFGIDKPDAEMDFVKKFIDAITDSLSEETGEVSAYDSFSSGFANRINNLEALYSNPYKPSVKSIATNMLLRSGIASHLTGSAELNNPSKLGSVEDMKNLAEIDFKNIQPLLLQMVGLEKDELQDLSDFCNFFRFSFNDEYTSFNEDSIPLNPNGSQVQNGRIVSTNPNQKVIDSYKDMFYEKSGRKITLRQIVDTYLPSIGKTGVDPLTLRSNYVILGKNLYSHVKQVGNNLTYIVFEGKDAERALKNYPSTDSSVTQPDGAFKIEYMDGDLPTPVSNTFKYNSLNASIGKKLVYSFNKLEKFSENHKLDINTPLTDSSLNNDYLFDKAFEAKETPASEDSTDVNWVYKNDAGQTSYAAMIVSNTSAGADRPVFELLANTGSSIRQRHFLGKLSELVAKEIESVLDNKQDIKDDFYSRFNDVENDIYKQFHSLYQQWSSMAQVGDEEINSSEVRNRFSKEFGDHHLEHRDVKSRNDISDKSSTAFVYQFPLQSISNEGGRSIDIRNAIISTKPLREAFNNTSTTVLNVIQNVCHKNNFTFIPIPGNPGYDSTKEIFSPQLSTKNQSLFNTFHVLFLPTPESRTSLTNNNTFQGDLVQTRESVSPNVEGFIIKFGSSDNQIVKSVNVDTVDNKITAESIFNLDSIIKGEETNQTVLRDCSMLSVMSGRSYKAKLSVLGNAKIFPTQFFFLDRSPLFGGLYQIMNVTHTITPNNMETNFDGIRMRFAGGDYSAVMPITKDYYLDLSKHKGVEEKSTFNNGEKIKNVKGELDPFIEGGNYDVNIPEISSLPESINSIVIEKAYKMNSGEYFKTVHDKNMIFLHHTAGGPHARNDIAWWNNSDSGKGVGTSYLISRDDGNQVHECFDPKYWAYHLGVGSNGNSHALDKQSIGIELCAYGGLKKKDGKFYAWPPLDEKFIPKFETEIPLDEVISLKSEFRGYKYYQKYTDTQIQSLEKLIETLVDKFGINIQSGFDMSWFDYNSSLVKKPIDGIWTHTNVRKTGKWDLYPDPRIIGMLRRLSAK